ncbi:ABR006Wp [Eremothecium gossypii ATCC 10895]|uniref:ABR006Wp n=1 Tax=Eremothecium gossypii (strain ATCC 10895 / CBS 109.51 / FGSC 9923 / NRRL Y-1056) TaxID=284811 RepID=Q75DS5_EREGS|nr:ABR006Wp [Eremothecium gossypii ATCC 10895]AAS50776.1 ABR006Wp [Eremothecium gossypii ATCC 10895]AEY95065.1 FABR006Wp [Eremothecium gossypii FDAG1]
MSDDRYSQIERGNDRRLDELSNKLSTFRSLNRDIGNQAAADNTLIDEIQNSFGALFVNIRNSSSRLSRAILAGNSVWKMVGLSLLILFVLYNVFKLF